MGLKLRSRDSGVLGIIEHRAGAPLSQFAKKLKIKEGTLRYYVQTLVDKGVIVGCTPYVNLCLLGFTNYTLLLSLAASTQQQKKDLFSSLCKTDRTAWVGRFSGPYEMGAVILAKGAEDLSLVYREATEPYGSFIREKNVSIKTHFVDFGHTFLSSEGETQELSYKATSERVKVDETDLKILSTMLSNKTIALRQVERHSGIPFSTVRRRVARMEEAGVIVGNKYHYNLREFGIREYSLLLRGSSSRDSLAEALLSYCRKSPHIRSYIRTFGSWDYELLISVPAGVEIQGLVDQIFEEFGPDFRQAALLEIFEEGKVCAAPGLDESPFVVTLAA